MDQLLQELYETEEKSAAFDEKIKKNFEIFQLKIRELIEKPDDKKNSEAKGKKTKQLAKIRDRNETEEEISENSDASQHSDTQGAAALGPKRSARTKTLASFKEPPLNSKLRRPTIKKERVSDDSKENTAPNYIDPDVVTISTDDERSDVRSTLAKTKKPDDRKRKSNDEGFGSGHSNRGSDVQAGASKKVKLSDGIEIIESPTEVPVEILSDEDTEKMPPPAMPPPKARGRPRTRKQANKQSSEENESIEIRVKQERVSTVEISVSSMSTRSTRTKNKKKQEPPVPLPIVDPVVKIEKISADHVPTNKRPSASQSEASLYEDAMTNGGSRQGSHSNSTENITPNATFTKPITPNTTTTIENATFAIPSGNNETFQVESPDNINGTYTLPASTEVPNRKMAYSHDSIMTEDRSDEDSPMPLAKSVHGVQSDSVLMKNGKQVTKKHEIFNPIVPSPVKAKVQAYERHAATGGATFMSPANLRFNSKIATPTAGSKATTPFTLPKGSSHKFTTPVFQGTIVATLQKEKAASTSKLAHIQKKVTGTLQKQVSMSGTSRDPSVEDLKRTQAAIEEKKRLREEKQRKAQYQRDQLAKERAVRMQFAQKEKEEKAKKLMLAKQEQSQKKMDEQLRHQKVMDQKRRELQERQELEALKSKHNESLSRKVFEKSIQQAYNKKHAFDVLDTDDSTDDEGSVNKKLGPPPVWSKGRTKRFIIDEQSRVTVQAVDDFFSIKPMTPDLQQIFPTIETRKLKRNSSAVWRTPPRYSEIPKY